MQLQRLSRALNKDHRLLKRTRNFTLEWYNYGILAAFGAQTLMKGNSRVTLCSISICYHYCSLIFQLYKLHVKTKWNRPGPKSFLEAVIVLATSKSPFIWSWKKRIQSTNLFIFCLVSLCSLFYCSLKTWRYLKLTFRYFADCCKALNLMLTCF